jgi:NADH-quinone oxidoreductase subunit M
MLGATNTKGFCDISLSEGITMVALAAVLLFFGLYPKPINDLITPSLEIIAHRLHY